MSDDAAADLAFNTMASRLIRREALRRAAQELNTASPPGLENALAQISAEVTQEAEDRLATPPAAGVAPAPEVAAGLDADPPLRR